MSQLFVLVPRLYFMFEYFLYGFRKTMFLHVCTNEPGPI